MSIDIVTHASGGAELDSFIVPWDTDIFGFPVAQVSRMDFGTPGTEVAGVFDAFDAWCAAERVRLVSCRLDHSRIRESIVLEDRGFRFIEQVLEPRLDALDRIDAPRHELLVTEATEADLPAIEAIAASAFTTGRFLLDPRLPSDLSRRRYARWVRSSFTSPSQHVLKAESAGALVGFFIVEHRDEGAVYWHLTAVAPAYQGRGLGLSLWRTMLRRHAGEGATKVETTISGHNLPAINLYGRLGFTFPSSQLTFHRLIELAR